MFKHSYTKRRNVYTNTGHAVALSVTEKYALTQTAHVIGNSNTKFRVTLPLVRDFLKE